MTREEVIIEINMAIKTDDTIDDETLDVLNMVSEALKQPKIIRCIFCVNVKSCWIREHNSLIEFCSVGRMSE